MGINYLWDTNIVIYFLQNQFTTSAEHFIDDILKHSSPAISVISEIELLCWKTTKEKDLEVLNSFIKESTVYELEKRIKLKTADIRKTHKIKLPDAIIAATAIIYDISLLTRNIKDFKDIDNLKVINPFDK